MLSTHLLTRPGGLGYTASVKVRHVARPTELVVMCKKPMENGGNR